MTGAVTETPEEPDQPPRTPWRSWMRTEGMSHFRLSRLLQKGCMGYHNELGKWGEEVAASYLRQLGYTILHRDWDYRHRDLDIVAMDNGVLVIIEVKTRKNERFADADEVAPEGALPLSCRQRLCQAVRHQPRGPLRHHHGRGRAGRGE